MGQVLRMGRPIPRGELLQWRREREMFAEAPGMFPDWTTEAVRLLCLLAFTAAFFGGLGAFAVWAIRLVMR